MSTADEETRDLGPPVPSPQTGAPSPDGFGPGDQVGRFTLLRLLGRGGMAVVFAARDPHLNREVALKLVRVDRNQATDRARLLREAQAMARLSHPNVVAVHEVGVAEGPAGETVFIAMELVSGSTLKSWLREKRRSWREVLEVFLQAGRGLATAHAAGFVHRDFKPDNVLISSSGRAQVSDFGLARSVGVPEGGKRAAATPESGDSLSASIGHDGVTQDGVVVGTLAYMAPEQLRAEPLDERSDLFSFSVALFEALYGERPYSRDDAVLTRKPLPTRRRLPAWLARAVERGIALDPAARFPSMAALLAALEADPSARRRWWLATAGGLTAGLVIFFGGLRLSHQPSPCDAPERQLDGTWNEAVREKLKAAFLASGAPAAAERWIYAEKSLDREAALWIAGERDVCAQRAAETQSESATSLRLECLDRQREEFQVVLDMLSTPSPALVDAAPAVVQQLSLPLQCADARVVPIVDRPPKEKVAAAGAIRAQAIRAEGMCRTGQRAEAIQSLNALSEQATALGDLSLVELTQRWLNYAYEREDKYDAALTAARAARDAAQAARMDVEAAIDAAHVYCDLAFTVVPDAELEAARQDLSRAVERANDSPLARMWQEFILGAVSAVRGRNDEGQPHTLKMLEIAKQIEGPDWLFLNIVYNNLAANEDVLGQEEQAIAHLREAIALSDRVVGPNRDNLRLPWLNLGWILQNLGRSEEARAALGNCIVDPENFYSASCRAIRADSLAAEGRLTDAVADADHALQLTEQLKVTDAPDGIEVLRRCAMVYARAGQAAKAKTLIARAIKNEARDKAPDSLEWVPVLSSAGEVALATGDAAGAVQLLDRALALAKHPYPGQLALLRFALAQALVAAHRDRARAYELASAAEAELAPIPERTRRHADVVAWLQANRPQAAGPLEAVSKPPDRAPRSEAGPDARRADEAYPLRYVEEAQRSRWAWIGRAATGAGF